VMARGADPHKWSGANDEMVEVGRWIFVSMVDFGI
jgi:hypothetical protein